MKGQGEGKGKGRAACRPREIIVPLTLSTPFSPFPSFLLFFSPLLFASPSVFPLLPFLIPCQPVSLLSLCFVYALVPSSFVSSLSGSLHNLIPLLSLPFSFRLSFLFLASHCSLHPFFFFILPAIVSPPFVLHSFFSFLPFSFL